MYNICTIYGLQILKANHCTVSCISLHPYLDFFPENLRAVSDEHGAIFHQDIAEIAKRYQSKWSVNALADYCWSFMTDVCKRKSFLSVITAYNHFSTGAKNQ